MTDDRELAAPASVPVAFASSETRYQIERRLGLGGTGAVFLVRESETGEQLALKKLFGMDAKTILRLKREFRALQAINHPNIIKLYDMGHANDAWFLTMEYVDGVDLATYLNAEHTLSGDTPKLESAPAVSDRLVSAFGQLACGVQALHDAGMLHRDLKPSNVLVVDNRVVVLDFGLVHELSAEAVSVTEDGLIAGTPAYMAPEQIESQPLTAASDWYAVGVMLYEAVSGLLPVDGSLLELLRAKVASDPTPLIQCVPDAPRWLNDLCMALLQRDPAQRPRGQDVIATLTRQRRRAALQPTNTELVTQTEVGAQHAKREFVGRVVESEQLWTAFGKTQGGDTAVVHVVGESGSGKSALVEHFLDQLERLPASGHATGLVLRSRCHELEAMPFKALDGLIDALVFHLSTLDDLVVANLLPASVNALAQVFPVLHRLNATKRIAAAAKPMHDAIQTRRHAETALRALLENVATRTPLVLWIDDLHWGDLDSARILKSWLVQPSASPLLFIFSYRNSDVSTSTCLHELLEASGATTQALSHTIHVPPLEVADIRALCEQRLKPDMRARGELIARIVQEAQGNAFMASQLIALAEAKSERGDSDLHTLSLELMVAQTSALLVEDAQRILAFLAVAGTPLAAKDLLRAAGVARGGRSLVRDLRALNLVRTREVSGVRMLEVYHDRVRERVKSSLSVEESRRIHAGLLHTFEASGRAEPDWLHIVALGAEEPAQALHYGKLAAARANASLAFERAAGLYRQCITLGSAADSGQLWSELSVALARCGRGFEAAEASLEAAKHAAPAERVAWLQRAAAHFMRSGRFERGDALLREVLAAHKIRVPATGAGLRAAIVWERARIRLHGSADTLRDVNEIPGPLLARIDLLASLFLSTSSQDPLRAALFQARALRCALEAGEPRRLVQALSSESYTATLYGAGYPAQQSDQLLARAVAINARLPAPDPKPICTTRAARAFLRGHMREVLDTAREAEQLFRSDSQNDPAGNYHRRFVVASGRAGALQFFGQYAQFIAEVGTLVEEATITNNRLVLLQLTYAQTVAEQIQGRAALSRPRLEQQRTDLPNNSFGSLHLLHMIATMSDVCWSGDYDAVSQYLTDAWEHFSSSAVRGVPTYALRAHGGRAQLLLNLHVAERRAGDPSASVRDELAALVKVPLPAAAAAVQRYRARLAYVNGQKSAAALALRASIAAYQQIGTPHEAARDQAALGKLLGADEGLALRSAAEQAARELGVVDVEADLRAHYPELFVV